MALRIACLIGVPWSIGTVCVTALRILYLIDPFLCLCFQACTKVCDGLEGFVPQLILFMHLYWSASVLRFLYLGTFLKHCAHYVRLTKNFCSWMILFRVLFRHHASRRSRLCETVDSPWFCRASRLPKWLPAWLYATALSLEENAHRT